MPKKIDYGGELGRTEAYYIDIGSIIFNLETFETTQFILL